ncbi:MAG: MFS transporter [Muribaculaceae bacterium]|nr:MFS transporter [Muribaculaceae bacterium]
MTEKVQKTLASSALARWGVLMIVSFTMMTGYIVAKQVSPLEYFLELPSAEGGMNWTSSEFGFFAGSRGFFNVFFLMLFVSGYILDKTGVRFAGVLSCVLMLVGTVVDYYAIAFISPEGTCAFFGTMMKIQVLIAAGGFALFGIGYELCGITVSKVIVKWFSGQEMALAMGLQVALARLGTALALGFSPKIAQSFSLSTPLLIGMFSVGTGTIFYLFYCTMDSKLDKQKVTVLNCEEEKFRFADLKETLKNGGFWLITLLCMLYYSSLYPFLDFATKLMISKYGVEAEVAGMIPAILPFTSIILTPLFGAMYDNVGRGATIMIIGTVMLTVVLMVFALPLTATWIAIAAMLVLGIAFSLLPSVLWPAVPKIVPMNLLGTAYSIIYYIQNIGLMLVPIVIGVVLSRNTTGATTDYTQAMWLFSGIGIAAICVAVMLLYADKRNNYGLEAKNKE